MCCISFYLLCLSCNFQIFFIFLFSLIYRDRQADTTTHKTIKKNTKERINNQIRHLPHPLLKEISKCSESSFTGWIFATWFMPPVTDVQIFKSSSFTFSFLIFFTFTSTLVGLAVLIQMDSFKHASFQITTSLRSVITKKKVF